MVAKVVIKPSKLPRLPGFELEPPLYSMHGRWDRLQAKLLTFTERYREANGQLRSLIEEEQWLQVQSLLQELKGKGNTLGATSIARLSAELEAHVKTGARELPEMLLDQFALCVGELAEAECILHALDDENKQAKSAAADPACGRTHIKNIENSMRTLAACLHNGIGNTDSQIDLLITQCRGTEMESVAMQIQTEFSQFNVEEISTIINHYFASYH